MLRVSVLSGSRCWEDHSVLHLIRVQDSEAKAQMHCLGEAIYFGRAVSTDSPDIQKLAEPPIDLWWISHASLRADCFLSEYTNIANHNNKYLQYLHLSSVVE